MDQLTLTPLSIVLIAIDLALLVLAVRRPWLALISLLGGLPFNGILLDVIAPSVGISSTDTLARLALAGWHDALALGIVIAGAWSAGRTRQRPTRAVEYLAGLVLVFGLVALVKAPGLLVAAYAYRTLYLPVAVMLALLLLATSRGMPDRAAPRAALAMVVAGLIAAAFAIWQVYAGGYPYLMAHYQVDSRLPAAYTSALVHQPRAIGTFHSPNEMGAYLVIAGVIALAPGILPLGRLRPWAGVLLGIGLLLTFSRSGWVAATISTLVILALTGWRPRAARLQASLVRNLAPIVVFIAASGLILTTSNGFDFVKATVTGHDPSAGVHLGALGDLLGGGASSSPSPSGGKPGGVAIRVTMLGEGLGTAGPKSTRFTGGEPIRHSEIWYVDYIAQVGLVGLFLTALLVGGLLAELWRARPRAWPAAATAVLLALGVGALFIPVIDEPAVAGPLWAVLGLAMIDARTAHARITLAADA